MNAFVMALQGKARNTQKVQGLLDLGWRADPSNELGTAATSVLDNDRDGAIVVRVTQDPPGAVFILDLNCR